MNNSPTTNPLLWTEGMLLTPQHLQQNDRYWALQMQHQSQQLQPWYWGLMDLSLDEAALERGELIIEHLWAVMKDGLIVQAGVKYGRPKLSLILDSSAGRQVTVSLLVPEYAEGAASENGMNQRYRQPEQELADDISYPGRKIAIGRMEPVVELWAGPGERSGAYTSIPLLYLVQTAPGKFQLDSRLPPLLTLSAGDYIKRKSPRRLLEGLEALLRSYVRKLSGSGQIERWQLAALVTALPPLQLLVRTADCHPFEVMKGLAALYGQLLVLQPEGALTPLPEYSHDDPSKALFTAIACIKKLLEQINLNWDIYRFATNDNQLFTLEIEAGWKPKELKELIVEVRPSPGQSPEDVESWFSEARIGVSTLLPHLQKRRSAGLQRSRLTAEQSQQVSSRMDSCFFRLKQTSLTDENNISHLLIQPGTLLAIQSDRQDSPLEITYYRDSQSREGG